jgi:hypothetical protein
MRKYKHYKIVLETGKKKSTNRILYVKVPADPAVDGIIYALDISRKIRDSRLRSIVGITHEHYMKGIDMKYTNESHAVF